MKMQRSNVPDYIYRAALHTQAMPAYVKCTDHAQQPGLDIEHDGHVYVKGSTTINFRTAHVQDSLLKTRTCKILNS